MSYDAGWTDVTNDDLVQSPRELHSLCNWDWAFEVCTGSGGGFCPVPFPPPDPSPPMIGIPKLDTGPVATVAVVVGNRATDGRH